jgi:hypothetical protein
VGRGLQVPDKSAYSPQLHGCELMWFLYHLAGIPTCPFQLQCCQVSEKFFRLVLKADQTVGFQMRESRQSALFVQMYERMYQSKYFLEKTLHMKKNFSSQITTALLSLFQAHHSFYANFCLHGRNFGYLAQVSR